jgi:hypothetical protein
MMKLLQGAHILYSGLSSKDQLAQSIPLELDFLSHKFKIAKQLKVSFSFCEISALEMLVPLTSLFSK